MTDSFTEMMGYTIPDKLTSTRVGVVPIGSLEYHGPHMPVGTDSLIAVEVARRVAEDLDAVLFPLIAYTGEHETRGFRGTISIDGRVFIDYMAEVLRGILRSGLGGVLMMGAHGENEIYCPEAGRLVANDFPKQKVMFASWWDPLPNSVLVDEMGLFPFKVIGYHGGGVEVTITACIAPHAVDVSKASGEEYVEHARPWAPIRYIKPDQRGPTPEFAGYNGPTRLLDAEKGEFILRESSRRIAASVRAAMASNPGS